MGARAEVFISATTCELCSYREEVKNALLTLGVFPIEQSNFALAHGPLTEVLHGLIGRRDAVIHLAGFYYGAEPPQRRPGERRRSYTQIEYDVARELGKTIYLFLAAENCETDERSTQSEEEKKLQLAHRRAIENSGDIYYPFANREDLARRVRELELPVSSTKASRRVVNLPYLSLGRLFKGRDAALADLRRQLRSGPCQAIYGLGGVAAFISRRAVIFDWELVARVDLKADRKAGMLIVQRAHVEPGAPQCTVERLIEELRLMASWLGLAGLAIAPVAGIDRLFATLHVEAHPAFAELAPAQSERACYG